MRRSLAAVVVGSLTVTLAASACSPVGGGSNGGHTSRPGGSFIKADDLEGPAPAIEGAKQGGILTILGSTDFNNADPQANYSFDGIQVYTQLIFRTLVGYYEDVDRDGHVSVKLAGDLAKTTGTSDNGCRTWTYRLRDGIKFEDGSPIRSKDIAYGISRSFDRRLADGPQVLQRALAGGGDYGSAYPGPFVNEGTSAPGISTPDDKTIVFTFAKPFCDFPLAATLPTTIPVPVAKDPGPGEYEKDMVASGPYRIESWIRGKRMTLVRNTAWDPSTDPLRHNYPDKFVFDWSASDSVAATNRFVADAGDDQYAIQWDQVPSSELPTVLNNPNVKARLIEGDTAFNYYLYINTQRVTDVDERRALNYAVDKEAILKLIGGAGRTITTITAPTVPGYRKYDAYQAPASGDVEKAKQLLAGKTPTLRLCYRSGTRTRDSIAAEYQTGLARAGFKIVLSPTDAASYYTLVGDKNYVMNEPGCDLITGGWAQGYPSNATVLGVLMKGGIFDKGNNNLSYLDAPDVNAELARLAAEPDVQKAAEGYMALDQKIMSDYAPLVPIYNQRSFSLVGSKVGGAYLNTTWDPCSLQNIFIRL